MPKVELSLPADEDVRGIWRFTAASWSERQAQIYVGKLFDAMEALAAGARAGHPADDISTGLRRENCASHAILYRQRDGGIFVVRVLHQRMHFSDHLAEEG